MTGFDRVIVVDWSARAAPSPRRESADAIWIAEARDGRVDIAYLRTRHAAEAHLRARCDAALADGARLLAGFDFPFAYPRGFARALTGRDDPLGIWSLLADRIVDGPDNANNRFDVASDLNRRFPGVGPFWGCPVGRDSAVLPAKGTLRQGHGLPERRVCETRLRTAQPCWKLFTTGSVGSQALLGIPRLHALRTHYGQKLAVRPFEHHDAPLVFAELFPSLIADTVAALRDREEIKDRAQVRVLAAALAALPGDALEAMTRDGNPVEGWILGLGHETALREAALRGAAQEEPSAEAPEETPPGPLSPPRQDRGGR